MTATIGRSDRSRCAAAGRVRDPAFGRARELQRRVAAARPCNASASDRDLRLRTPRRPARRRGRRRSTRAARRLRGGPPSRLRRRRREHPLLQRLASTVRECDLPRDPFLRLIEANRRDQRTSEYGTFDELVEYCDLSANPVGELVLHVFGAATPERIALSDRVCTALQLAEHWQDVARGLPPRPHLPPGRGSRALRCRARQTSERGRRAHRSGGSLEFEVERARALLDEGAPLVGHAARPRPHRGRRLRRRWARRARRDRRSELRRASRRAARDAASQRLRQNARGARRPADEPRGRLRGMPPHRARLGIELLRRDAPAPGGSPRRALRDLRPGAAHRRHRGRRPHAGREARRARECPSTSSSGFTRRDDPVVARGGRRGAAATRSHSKRSATSSTAPRWTSRGHDYATFADTELYGRRVAGSIGRLALGVFETHGPRSSRAAGGRARRRAPAHEHPARHQRGRAHRSRVPADARTSHRFGCHVAGRADRRTGRAARRVRGAARARPARARTDARAAARPPQRRLRARDGGLVPAAARADRGATRSSCSAAGRRCAAGRRAGCSRRASRGARRDRRARRGRRRRPRGDRRRARARRRGRDGDAVRSAHAARRRDLLGRAARTTGSTTASTCSCAAAPRTAASSRGSASSTSCRSSRACASRCCARASRPRSCAAHRCPRRCTSCPRSCASRRSARASASNALRAAAALRKLDPADAALDERTFGEWLARARASPTPRSPTLWNLITLPTLNLPADEASLALATMVFRTGLLDAADACDIGVPAVPLQRLHGDAAAAALERAGVRVALGTPVRRVGRAKSSARRRRATTPTR